MAGDKVIQVNDLNFDTEVLSSGVPVLVDFSATWCQPCRAIAPFVNQLAGEYEGRVKVTTVDIDESPATAQKYRIRGARIGLGYVSVERSRSYGFDFDAWRRMMLDASSVEPAVLRRNGQTIQRLLSHKGRVVVTARNGTHFEFDLTGRKAVLDDGVITKQKLDEGENMASVPAGEVAVLPDAASGEGTIRFDRPVASIGRWMKGVTVAFENGRAVKWSAEENDGLLRPDWEKGGKDRGLLAGFDIGLNPAAQTGFLQDYLQAGNVYIAIGDAEEFGGKSTTDFYLASTLTGATVTVGGKTVVEGGRLVA